MPPAAPPPPARPAFNPYATIAVSILLGSAAQVFLKIGTNHPAELPPFVPHFAAILFSGWGWLGIIALVASLGTWTFSLRHVPLNIAANLTACEHVLVPLASWGLLGESIGLLRWTGIVLVIAGVSLVARSVLKQEQKSEEPS